MGDPGPWVRKGECNNCGWCCQMLTRLVITVAVPTGFDKAYYEARGVQWASAPNSDLLAVFPGVFFCPCPQHDNEGKRCRIHETRPQTCRDFPISPSQIVASPCSYWFERELPDGSTERVDGTAPQEWNAQHGFPD